MEEFKSVFVIIGDFSAAEFVAPEDEKSFHSRKANASAQKRQRRTLPRKGANACNKVQVGRAPEDENSKSKNP